MDHLKIFGTQCFVHVPKQKRLKLDPKSIKGLLVGYCGNKDGYRIYIPDRDDVITSRDVIFKDELVSVSSEMQVSEDSSVDVPFDVDDDISESNSDNVGETVQSLRDRRQLKLPVRFDDYAMFTEYSEPQSYADAMNSHNSHDWRLAMDDEIKSLATNDTWELVDKPDDRLVVDNRWIYKVKTKVDGSVDKFKARLVAKGYSQKAGIDYNETFSPVARFDTIRAVLSVPVSEKLKLMTFDVKTAFLYGTLDEIIYMKQPQGYEDGTDRVCKLTKSLYGLKQSPRCWNKRFKDFTHCEIWFDKQRC